MDDLQKLGAKSVPVVSKGDKFVFAQVIRDVVEFLEIDEDPSPELSPYELDERYEGILDITIKLVRQFPNNSLKNELPNRPRSWKVLLHHVFQIPKAFLDHEENGKEFTYEMMTEEPPENLKTSKDIADFGEEISKNFRYWWVKSKDGDFTQLVPTYFGKTTRHELLERTVWHSTQHARQIESLLESIDINPAVKITKEQLERLPLTEEIWDNS